MTLTEQINDAIKEAMKSKNKDRLDALRAVKSALLLAATEKGAGGGVSEDTGLKVLQKLVKQRRESSEIYISQQRVDLSEIELRQAAIIEEFLPAQMLPEEVTAAITEIIALTGAAQPSDMGKVMGIANARLAGRADGKLIADTVRRLLAS
ncbi:MAG: GatB/YqeY domain-containing protein [Flavobacteriales bacterium]|jgi:uncharacterized protein YqeY|nr:GatB/YqeY domain-containing protein [Flavobacteriales bacterium]